MKGLNKRSAGIFYYYVTIADGKEKKKVVLTRRANNGKQTFPGVYQCSANGIIEDRENVFGCLERETREELGDKFVQTVNVYNSKEIHEECYEYNDIDGKHAEVDACCRMLEIQKKQVDLIELSEEHDKIIIIGAEDMSKIKTKAEVKETGFNPDEEIVMFPDQLRALEKVFEQQKE
ncbi:NUDIX hydrolase [Candidatus Parcubacteria bacterium]|nr:NUDIX hydrolase [Candidatus Parcubacteria bacterium]